MQRIDADERSAGFLARHRIKLLVAALALGGVTLLVVFSPGGGESMRPAPAPQIVAVTLPPPPPPPPPPKPREPRPEPADQPREMIAQEAINEPDPAPAEAAPSNDAPLGTGIVGDGPADGFGLGTGPGGGGSYLGGSGRAGGSGNALGRYGYQVKTGVETALAAHPRTRALDLSTRLRLWIDADGRVERVELGRDARPETVEAVREALVGLQIRQAAPKDTPMPVVLRLSARRPS